MKLNKRKIKTIFKVLLFAAIVFMLSLALFVLVIYIYRFDLVKVVTPKAAALFGIKNVTFDIKSLNSSNIHLTNFSTGTISHKGLSLKNIQFNRSENAPNKLLIEGMRLNLWLSDHGILIPGLETGHSSDPESDDDQETNAFIPTLLKIPMFLAPYIAPGFSLHIKNSYCNIYVPRENKIKILKLPLDLSFSLNEKGHYDMAIIIKSENLDNLPFLPDEFKINSMDLQIQSSGFLSASKKSENLKADLSFILRGISCFKNNIYIKIPELKISGTAKQQDNSIESSLIFSASNITGKMNKIRIYPTSISFPIGFTYTNTLNLISSNKKQNGFMNISDLAIGKTRTGPIKIDIAQKNNKFQLMSQFKPKFLHFSNSQNSVVFQVEILLKNLFNTISLSADIGASDFSPAEKLFSSENPTPSIQCGLLKILANINLHNGRIVPSTKIIIKETNITNKEKNLTINNLNAQCEFPNLLHIKSLPAQSLTCDSISCGNLKFSDAEVVYQIESSEMVFVEKTNIKWCAGNLDLASIRLNLKDPENISTTIFCAGINAMELMKELKIAQAEGDGSLAGRIPISYKHGKIRIDHAFLYSIPGKGGTIKISDFSNSYLDIAATTPLDIAKEALADYKYKWIKLRLNTKGAYLFIKLQLDGAPNARLPFTYDSEKGLIRSKDQSQKAHFQGISFEFNFNNIPLDSIWNMGKNSNKIFNEIKNIKHFQ